MKHDILQDFKLLEEIGSGSFGKVFKAMSLGSKELRAIKVIKMD